MRVPFREPNRFRSTRWWRLALWGIGFGLSFSGFAPAFAQVVQPPATVSPPQNAALHQQVQSLRTRLAALTTEIQNLKKKSRTVAEDYRLREKLSEADVVGRRLTASEAQLRQLPGATPPLSQWLQVNPSAPLIRPGDGPRELDAKADILLDQAERFATEAARMEAQVLQSERRDTLRRRVRRIENDPFIALEASKRSLVLSSQSLGKPETKGNRESADDGQGAGFVTGMPVSTPANMPAVSDTGAAAAPVAPMNAPPVVAPSGGRGETTMPTAASPSFSGSDALTGHAVLPPQFRTLLDPQTLAEVRRLEGVGTPASRAAALRAAVAGLRSRAAALQQQSKTLRQSK
jgi:cell division protein FtsB